MSDDRKGAPVLGNDLTYTFLARSCDRGTPAFQPGAACRGWRGAGGDAVAHLQVGDGQQRVVDLAALSIRFHCHIPRVLVTSTGDDDDAVDLASWLRF